MLGIVQGLNGQVMPPFHIGSQAKHGSGKFLGIIGQQQVFVVHEAVAFSPNGTRMYFSSQRNPGATYEVTGPW